MGTHGHMKCIFNDWIKHNDVICMPLYRRVFPNWYERSWNPRAALVEKKRKHETFDAEEESKEAATAGSNPENTAGAAGDNCDMID